MPIVRLTVFVAWISGLVPLDKPWGIPRFSSWFSVSGLWSVCTLLAVVIFSADVALSENDLKKYEELSKLGRYLNDIASTHRMVFYLITRFTFLCNAKEFANTYGKLDTYPTKKGNVLRKSLKFFDKIVVALSYLCGMITAFTGTALFVTLLQKAGGSFLMNSLGCWTYGVLLGAFGIFPICLCDTVAFGLIVTAVRALLSIFREFCEELADLLRNESDSSIKSDLLPMMKIQQQQLESAEHFLDLENEFRRFVEIKPQEMKKTSIASLSGDPIVNSKITARQDILLKFYRMVDISEAIGKVTSPFVFVILMVTTVELVAAVSGIVVLEHKGNFFWIDILSLITVAVHLCLLQIGHRIQVTLEKGKDLVRRTFFLAPLTATRNGLRDVVSAVLMWDWKLTGFGFFDVDRKLAAGIISLLLSYVVIIFQLQLALSPNSVRL